MQMRTRTDRTCLTPSCSFFVVLSGSSTRRRRSGEPAEATHSLYMETQTLMSEERRRKLSVSCSSFSFSCANLSFNKRTECFRNVLEKDHRRREGRKGRETCGLSTRVPPHGGEGSLQDSMSASLAWQWNKQQTVRGLERRRKRERKIDTIQGQHCVPLSFTEQPSSFTSN